MVDMNNKLNPVIWNDDMTLKDGVVGAINNIVSQFVDDLEIPIDIVDVRIVGSNASYNYNAHSDIDIHLVVSTDTLPYSKEALKLIYKAARNKFNKYYSIKIKGLPIELSIEDLNSNVCSNGVYSITNNMWIKRPVLITRTVQDVTTTESYTKLVDRIKSILDNPTSEKVKDMINNLYLVRKNSILVDGEYGQGNLIFKAIRNSGLLDALKEELYIILSKELTFENLVEDADIYRALMMNPEDD